MAGNFQITCVLYEQSLRHPSSISDYGNHRGGNWIISKPDAIKLTYAGDTFFTNETGRSVVARRTGSRPNEYLKTDDDSDISNNLTELNICPRNLRRRF